MDAAKLAAVEAAVGEWETAQFGEVRVGTDDDRIPRPSIKSFTGPTPTTVAVSPDCAYHLVKEAVDAAEAEILLYIYNATADHLLDLLRAATARGVDVRMMYDATDTRGNEVAKLNALAGVELKVAPSSGRRRVFPHCHQKFAVIDHSSLLLESANWANTSIPKVVPGKFKKGNREWLIHLRNAGLAEWFAELFRMDWDIPELPSPQGFAGAVELVPLEDVQVPALLLEPPDEVFDVGRIDGADVATVTPILSPQNYYDAVRELILAASDSVVIEQQYILAGGPKTKGLLAALEQRKGDIDIRIIVSPAFRKVGAKDNWELSRDSLDAYGLAGNLRAMNLKYYTHLHNKGLVVDQRWSVVSSTNWSENSIARAREAGVIVDSPAVADYFTRVFDFDWKTGWDPADVPDNLLKLFEQAMFQPGGFETVHPADLI